MVLKPLVLNLLNIQMQNYISIFYTECFNAKIEVIDGISNLSCIVINYHSETCL